MDERLEALERLFAGEDGEQETKTFTGLPEAHADNLRVLWKSISTQDEFKAGDIVMWKEHLSYMKRPLIGEPAIVTKVLDEPVYEGEERSSGSDLFRMALTIVIAFPEYDGTLMEYHVDGRRFQKVDL